MSEQIAVMWGIGVGFAAFASGWAARKMVRINVGEVVLFSLFWPLMLAHLVGATVGDLMDTIARRFAR